MIIYRYTVMLLRTNGYYKSSGEPHRVDGSNMQFSNVLTMESAKSMVAAYFKEGYYNYAEIRDKEDNTTIFRKKGGDWERRV